MAESRSHKRRMMQEQVGALGRAHVELNRQSGISYSVTCTKCTKTTTGLIRWSTRTGTRTDALDSWALHLQSEHPVSDSE